MDARNQDGVQENQQLTEIENDLLEPVTPDLSLRRKDHTVAFKLLFPRRRDTEADDLPDLTPELTAKLHALWNIEDVVEEQPIRVLVRAVREHLDAINPYIEVMKDYQRTWYECWQFLYKIAQNLDQASEDRKNERFYSAPESWRLMEMRARMNLGRADTEWEAAKLEYTNEFDKRRQKLVDLQNRINEITAAKELSELIKYDLDFNAIRDAAPLKTAPQKRGCLACLYTLFSPKSGNQQPAVVEKAQQDAQSFQDLRAKLLTRYNNELVFQTNNLNEFGDAAPRKSDKYSQEWKEIKAKILHNQIDFYRGQTKEVMLHCIRLYTLAVRTFYLIYGENPVADAKVLAAAEKMRVNKVGGPDDKIVLKAKECFRQMVKGMKSHLSLFYCLQPDRCDFTQYLSNYANITQQEERDAILAGNATDAMLEKVFPEFEAPEEAFRLPALG